MKKSKKLLIGVLSLALLVSGLGFASFAETPTEPENYGAVLEYYSQPNFLIDNFDGGKVGDFTAGYVLNGAAAADAHQKAEIRADGTNKYLVLNTASFGDANSRTGNFCLGWTSDVYANGVIADFDIYGYGNEEIQYSCTGSYTDAEGKEKPCGAKVVAAKDADAPAVCDKCGAENSYEKINEGKQPVVHVYLDSAKDDLSANTVAGTEIITLDFCAGTVSYLLADGSYATMDITVEAGKWYKVSLELNCLTGVYGLTVTDATDATKTATVSDVVVPAELKSIKTVRINTLRRGYENLAQEIGFDNVSIVGGSFRRNEAERQAKVEETLIRFAELCSATPLLPIEERGEMIDVYVALINEYKFTSGVAAVNEATETLGELSVSVYTELVESCVRNIDGGSGYYARLAHVEKYKRYNEMIPSDEAKLAELVGVDKVQWVVGVKNDYAAECESIEKLKADSEEFIRKTKIIDITVNDYMALLATYNEVATVNPDPYYDGVADALVVFGTLTSKINSIKEGADAFISNVALISTATGFTERYEAFCAAREGYFDNETYPGVTEAMADYEARCAELLPIEEACEAYILWIKRAEYSSYINAKEENVKEAAACNPDALEPDFPGIAEAKLTHAAILEEIEVKKAAASRYVAAVEALEGLTGKALEDGIAAAKELKKTGDIPGIDEVDVTGANITLSNLEASLTLYIAQSRQFVNLVGEIADAEGLAARFDAINKARRIADKATDSHEGVTAAKATLAAAINAYNADVAAVNGEYAAVTATATDVFVSAVKSAGADAITSKVVALIKKIFE